MVVMLSIIDYIHTRECEEILMKNWLLNCEIQFVKFQFVKFFFRTKKRGGSVSSSDSSISRSRSRSRSISRSLSRSSRSSSASSSSSGSADSDNLYRDLGNQSRQASKGWCVGLVANI